MVDPAAVEYNRRIVLASTITVLVLSNASYVLRLVARRMQHQRLQADDIFMGLALPFSKSDLAMEYHNVPVLAEHLLTSRTYRLYSCCLFTLRSDMRLG